MTTPSTDRAALRAAFPVPATAPAPWAVMVPREAAARAPAMRTMTPWEIDSFVSLHNFAVLALADGNHAYGVPLF